MIWILKMDFGYYTNHKSTGRTISGVWIKYRYVDQTLIKNLLLKNKSVKWWFTTEVIYCILPYLRNSCLKDKTSNRGWIGRYCWNHHCNHISSWAILCKVYHHFQIVFFICCYWGDIGGCKAITEHIKWNEITLCSC